MVMRGSCSCNNISVAWRNVDFSLVPRACGCAYCAPRAAAWVSKSGTAVEATVRKPGQYAARSQGSGQARFHECTACGDVVLVTVAVEGELYAAINVNCLQPRERFPQAQRVNFSGQDPGRKLDRWRENWCHPASVHFPGAAPVGSGDIL